MTTTGTVTFNKNGGVGFMANQSSAISTTLRPNAFIKDIHIFSGWNTRPDGSGTAYADGAAFPFDAAATTLYAQWAAPTVSFDSNGGTGTMADQALGESNNLTPNSFTRPGFVFAHWNTQPNGGGLAFGDTAAFPFDTAKTTLYAQWVVPSVSFDANGGSGFTPTQVSGTATALNANRFERTGYRFAGWNTSPSGLGQSYEARAVFPFSSASAVLYAQWEEVVPSVTFHGNGGDGTMATQSSRTAATLSPNSFARPGYVFTGWSTEPGGGGTRLSDQALFPFTAASTTLYAQWTVPTVTFDANGGTGSMLAQSSGSAITLDASTLSRSGHVFTGWNTQPNGEGVSYPNGALFPFTDAATTLYAQWVVPAAVFLPNGGTGSMPTQQSGTASALSANQFTWTGRAFTGWNTSADGSGTRYANQAEFPFTTASTTLYAQWAVPTVIFDSNGGTGTMPNQSSETPTALQANQFQNGGRIFFGWNTRPDGRGENFNNTAVFPFQAATTTLYALWAIPTVIFDANGASGGALSQSAERATPLMPNSFQRAGYVFTGWNTDRSGGGTTYTDGAEFPFDSLGTFLYAQWVVPTVRFDANGGDGAMPVQSSGTAITLDSSKLRRTGFALSGWNTARDGSGTAYADGGTFPFTEATTTLYAQWVVPTVSFDANGGNGSMPNQSSGTAIPLDSSSLGRTGHVFTGWNTARDGSGTAYADGSIFPFTEAATTLYAQWLPAHSGGSNNESGTGSSLVASENSTAARRPAAILAQTGIEPWSALALTGAVMFSGFVLHRRGSRFGAA